MTTPRTDSRPHPSAHLSRTARWAATGVLTASLLVITMDMTILTIALPSMAAEIQPTSTQQLWIMDVYSLVLAGLLVPWSAVADRWGRKKMLMLGYSFFILASLLVVVADSAAEVIAIRAFLGVGGAMIMPQTLSMIRVLFTDLRERATALSIWAAISGLGSALGPLVGGILLEHFSWHAAFLINVPLMGAAIIAGYFLLPESTVGSPGRWDWVAAVQSMVGMVLLVWSVKEFGKEASLAVPEALAAFAAAVAVLAWFTLRCLRSDSPLLELRLFRSRPFTAGIIAALGSTFAMIAALLLLAQWLQLVDGAGPVETGVKLIPVAVAAALASVAAPVLSRRIGSRGVVAGGIILAGAGMLYMGLSPSGVSYPVILVAMLLVGAGVGSLAVASAMIMGGSPEDKAGNAGALEEASYEIGGVLGVAVLGSISALVFRDHLASLAGGLGLPEELTDPAGESLGAAMHIAGEAGLPDLASSAAEAFTDSLQTAGIAGGLLMLAVGVAVFFITPKGTQAAH
ncbi:MAG: MFS transporter [Corynebacterium provencense]|uniref:MFS transporter n=1 Tax=Corynebacterium provencense TaxID=1737425 RepID=UPI002989F62B|nr:MFS transporter [Corynebacterium provencense]